MRAILLLVLMPFGLSLNAASPRMERIQTFQPFANSAFAIAVAPDAGEFAVAGYRGVLVVYDLESGQEKHRLPSPGGMILAMAYSPDGKLAATVGDPKLLRIYETKDWSVKREIKLDFRCGFVAFHPHRARVAVSGRGKTIDVFDVADGSKRESLGVGHSRSQGIRFSPDGDSLFAACTLGERHELRRYELGGGRMRTVGGGDGQVQSLTMSPGGLRYLAVGSKAGEVNLFGRAGEIEHVWRSKPLRDMGVFADKETVVVARRGFFEVWRAGSVDRVASLPSPDAENAHCAARIPGTNEFLICHARAKNQVTRWRFSSQ